MGSGIPTLVPHTLFVKEHKEGHCLIINLYVDNLLFTRNDSRMFKWFKESIIKTFDMTNVGKMKHLLGIEVV